MMPQWALCRVFILGRRSRYSALFKRCPKVVQRAWSLLNMERPLRWCFKTFVFGHLATAQPHGHHDCIYYDDVHSTAVLSAQSEFHHSYTGGPHFICVQYTMSFLKDREIWILSFVSGRACSYRRHNELAKFHCEVLEKGHGSTHVDFRLPVPLPYSGYLVTVPPYPLF